MKIEIPLKGGINSQLDLEEVGSGLTKLKNFDNFNTGKLVKRISCGQISDTLLNHQFHSIMHWKSPNGTFYYIAIDVFSLPPTLVRINSDFTVVERIAPFNTNQPLDFSKIVNSGDLVYINLGHKILSMSYQYIKRQLLWGTYNKYTDGGYFFEFATPRNIVDLSLTGHSIKAIKPYPFLQDLS